MADALKGVIIVILLAFVFGVYPAFRQSEVVERNTKLAANAAVVEFVDTVRAKGYVDVADYERFLHTLDASYAVFDVQMEYYKKKLEPLYTNPNDYSTFQNSFSVRYDGYFNKDILGVLYPGSAASLAADAPGRRFTMHVGDLFNVRLESEGTTLASRMRSMLFQSELIPLNLKYGGMVRSEAP
ncbi:hypothetical protein [Paenibacillus sp. MMS20-IR301]|uniref:hypothetical protein n=1 Tax=Paenibacillus sp. MMS20-IR301 TaxID=2895946 RepID=UPI0028E635D0|nr:hypothetical protein [Paenibacillus sp. MMS20-IR301]WNS41068.1 hypothetical protein LOS79_18675 [Paenibacillus sp. MMS20-IR301]